MSDPVVNRRVDDSAASVSDVRSGRRAETAPPHDFIPFTRAFIGDNEKAAVLRVLESGELGGNGRIGSELESRLRQLTGSKHVLLTTSCSHALELAAMALRVGPGDEVILPSFTFVTTASAWLRSGARPVFADIEEATCNLDPSEVERRVTPRTKVIVPVHYAGQAAAMDAILDIARRHGIYVVEDAAQGLGATYRDRPLGTIGDIGCFSFHVTKNIVCGEGGAFATNDDELAGRAQIIREKGTNRSRFLRGEVDKYTWVDVGSSFIPSDLLAAVALAQIQNFDRIHAERRRVWERYHEGLAPLEREGRIRRPWCAPGTKHNWHMYAIRVVDPARRDDVLAQLKSRGIGATFHYVPLHSSPYAREHWGYRPEDLPVTERVSASLVRLPLFPGLVPDDQDYVIDSLIEVARAW